jgi:hypothetical protein
VTGVVEGGMRHAPASGRVMVLIMGYAGAFSLLYRALEDEDTGWMIELEDEGAGWMKRAGGRRCGMDDIMAATANPSAVVSTEHVRRERCAGGVDELVV